CKIIKYYCRRTIFIRRIVITLQQKSKHNKSIKLEKRLTLVGIGHIIDSNLIGDGNVLRLLLSFSTCSNEGVSMLENASRPNLPIPEK
ncbi:MAG: phage holin family protein, partial [Eubacteriales bacterium]|nr:phage holin family protein [Eubacteriales bacterium]